MQLVFLDQLEAVGLGNLLGDLGGLLILVVLPIGVILYFWRLHKQVERRYAANRAPRTAAEARAHLKRRNGYLRVLAVAILVLVLFATYRG